MYNCKQCGTTSEIQVECCDTPMEETKGCCNGGCGCE